MHVNQSWMKHDISNHSNNITVQYYFIELIYLIETVFEKYNDSDLEFYGVFLVNNQLTKSLKNFSEFGGEFNIDFLRCSYQISQYLNTIWIIRSNTWTKYFGRSTPVDGSLSWTLPKYIEWGIFHSGPSKSTRLMIEHQWMEHCSFHNNLIDRFSTAGEAHLVFCHFEGTSTKGPQTVNRPCKIFQN